MFCPTACICICICICVCVRPVHLRQNPAARVSATAALLQDPVRMGMEVNANALHGDTQGLCCVSVLCRPLYVLCRVLYVLRVLCRRAECATGRGLWCRSQVVASCHLPFFFVFSLSLSPSLSLTYFSPSFATAAPPERKGTKAHHGQECLQATRRTTIVHKRPRECTSRLGLGGCAKPTCNTHLPQLVARHMVGSFRPRRPPLWHRS